MLNLIVSWYKAYGTPQNFLLHKATHVACGLVLSIVCCLLGYPLTGLSLVLVLAIGKEVVDEYQYHMLLSYHVFDVIVTVCGGLLGLLILCI